MLSPELTNFLLDGTDPSVRFLVLRDLLDRPDSDADLRLARGEIAKKGWAAKILEDQQPVGHWEGYRGDPDDLYRPKYIATNWRVIVLSDLGVTREDERIARGAQLILDKWSGPDGAFGGKGSELCITGNVVRMLVRFGYLENPLVQEAIEWLVRTQKADGGWHCFESSVGTLDCWEALAAFAAIPPDKRSKDVRTSIQRGAEFYLGRGLLTESDGTSYPPWHRMHYPTHYYYDFLVGLDALTALGFGKDSRLRPALELLLKKRNTDGTWNLDAAHPDLLIEDEYHPDPPVYPFLLEHVGFPSRWLTMVALRVLKRAGRGLD